MPDDTPRQGGETAPESDADCLQRARDICEPLLYQRPCTDSDIENPGLLLWRRDYDRLCERISAALIREVERRREAEEKVCLNKKIAAGFRRRAEKAEADRHTLLVQDHKHMIFRLRYQFARALFLFALHVIMPPSRCRQELSALLWTWNLKVKATLAARRGAPT